MDAEPYLIAVVPKNQREEIRVQLAEYRGSTFLDVRIFADTGQPDHIPTPKGIALAPDRIDALIEALRGAQREAERRGLVTPAG